MKIEMLERVRSQCGAQKCRAAFGMAALILLGGCASAPPLNFTPANVGLSATKHNAALISTTVTVAGAQEAKGKILAGTEGGIALLWKTALEDTIVRMAMFRDDAPTHLALVVKILQFDAPTMGLTMVTHATARYELIDRNSGAIVFSSDVQTDGRSEVGDDLMGANRVRLSVARSVQDNIADFLRQLASADLTTPVFPAQKQNAGGSQQ